MGHAGRCAALCVTWKKRTSGASSPRRPRSLRKLAARAARRSCTAMRARAALSPSCSPTSCKPWCDPQLAPPVLALVWGPKTGPVSLVLACFIQGSLRGALAHEVNCFSRVLFFCCCGMGVLESCAMLSPDPLLVDHTGQPQMLSYSVAVAWDTCALLRASGSPQA